MPQPDSSKEVFLAMDYLSHVLYGNSQTGLKIHGVKIYETPNCWTDCYKESITNLEQAHFMDARNKEIRAYAQAKGVLEYDDRKIK